MTEEATLRLFSLTLTAWRITNDQPEVAMRNIVAFLAGTVDVAQEGQKAARDLFPDADGWQDQSAFGTEIIQRMPVGPFRLTWHAELPADAEDEGAEQ